MFINVVFEKGVVMYLYYIHHACFLDKEMVKKFLDVCALEMNWECFNCNQRISLGNVLIWLNSEEFVRDIWHAERENWEKGGWDIHCNFENCHKHCQWMLQDRQWMLQDRQWKSILRNVHPMKRVWGVMLTMKGVMSLLLIVEMRKTKKLIERCFCMKIRKRFGHSWRKP